MSYKKKAEKNIKRESYDSHDWHHLFPQVFREAFDLLDFDIDETNNLLELPNFVHSFIFHSEQNNWNQDWIDDFWSKKELLNSNHNIDIDKIKNFSLENKNKLKEECIKFVDIKLKYYNEIYDEFKNNIGLENDKHNLYDFKGGNSLNNYKGVGMADKQIDRDIDIDKLKQLSSNILPNFIRAIGNDFSNFDSKIRGKLSRDDDFAKDMLEDFRDLRKHTLDALEEKIKNYKESINRIIKIWERDSNG